jgi:sugar/nucleoside kinase (ribokinase family)
MELNANDGKDFWFIPVYPHTPLERTGAGDSFSSSFIAALYMV